MRKLFLLLSFIATSFYFLSCTTSSSNNNVSPSPVLITNPTAPPTNITTSGFFRAYVNGILFDAPYIQVYHPDTVFNLGGRMQQSSTNGPNLIITGPNYENFGVGTYDLTANNGFYLSYTNLPTDDTGMHWVITAGQMVITHKTEHNLTGTFHFTREDGVQITNGAINISW